MDEHPEIPVKDIASAEVLSLDEGAESDYTLHKSHKSAWITVDKKISVHIIRADEGVIVDLFKYGDENQSLTSALLEFSEVEDEDV